MAKINDGPGIVEWDVTSSDSLSRSFGFAQGSAINFSGYSFLAQVRSERSSDAELLATLTVGTASAGTLVVSASTSVMDLDAGGYWWELQWTTGSSTRTILAGPFNVLPNGARS
ncbi:MAG: hypothetical protein ACKO04_03985 [Actinomycetes bacterium]